MIQRVRTCDLWVMSRLRVVSSPVPTERNWADRDACWAFELSAVSADSGCSAASCYRRRYQVWVPRVLRCSLAAGPGGQGVASPVRALSRSAGLVAGEAAARVGDLGAVPVLGIVGIDVYPPSRTRYSEVFAVM
jgi:hypothetical protein